MSELQSKIAYEVSGDYPNYPPQWHWTRAFRIIEHFTDPDPLYADRYSVEFKKYEKYFRRNNEPTTSKGEEVQVPRNDVLQGSML